MEIQWPLVFFTLFVGLGCGTFAAAVILTEWCGRARQLRLPAAVISLASLVIGGIASTLHLGHVERMFGALGHPTSGIFMESTMIALTGLAVFVYILALRRSADGPTARSIGTVGALLAIVLAFANGDAYVMAARPAWNTLLLPLLYVATAAVMGSFTLQMLAATGKSSEDGREPGLRKAALLSLAAEALLLLIYLGYLASAPYPDVSRSTGRVLAGNLALLFWGGIIVVGLLLPGAMLTKYSAQRPFKLSLVCVLIASAAFRILMFSLGSGVKNFFD